MLMPFIIFLDIVIGAIRWLSCNQIAYSFFKGHFSFRDLLLINIKWAHDTLVSHCMTVNSHQSLIVLQGILVSCQSPTAHCGFKGLANSFFRLDTRLSTSFAHWCNCEESKMCSRLMWNQAHGASKIIRKASVCNKNKKWDSDTDTPVSACNTKNYRRLQTGGAIKTDDLQIFF